MGIKLTQAEAEEKVKKYTTSTGFFVEPFLYIGSIKTQLIVHCDKGHQYEKSFNELTTQNPKCPICTGRKKGNHTDCLQKLMKICHEHDYSLTKEFVYENNRSMIHLRCNKDGHEWSTKYTSFVNTGYRCSKCAGLAKISHEDLVLRIIEKATKLNLKIISHDIKSSRNGTVTYECEHGHTVNTTSNSFHTHTNGCKVCNRVGVKRSKYDDERLSRLTDNLTEKGYSIISSTSPFCASTRFFLKCNKDGYEWNTTTNHLEKGTECPRCKGTGKLSQSEKKEIIEKISTERNLVVHTDVDDIKNIHSLLHITCEYGHDTYIKYNKLIHIGYGCSKCAGNKKLNTVSATNIVYEICLKNNLVLHEPFIYTNNTTPIVVRCLSHNHLWKLPYSAFVHGNHKCPRCLNTAKFNDEETNELIDIECEKRDYTKLERYKHESIESLVHLKCNKDGHEWKARYTCFVNLHTGCPVCAGKSQTYAYISSISTVLADGTREFVGIKYGIETINGKRTKQQNSKSTYLIERISTFEFENISDCHSAEAECKKIFQAYNRETLGRKGIVKAKDMKDGHSETTSIENLYKVIEIYEKHGAVELV